MTPVKTSLSCSVALFLVALLYVVSARWHVLYGGMNADEGFYAIGTRSVAHGEMPYRDFGFTQPPGVLYANALPLRLAGFGLVPQRIVNGLWAAAALALAAAWLARRTQLAWGLGLILLFSLSAPWMYFVHLGKTYGFTTLLVLLAAWVYLRLAPGPRRNALLGVLAVAGFATRLPSAPFFGLLCAFALWPGRRPTLAEILAAIGSVLVAALVVIVPFWIAAPESAKFWIFDFHRLSVPYKDWWVSWQEIVTLAPGAWLLALLAIIAAVKDRRCLTREFGVVVAALVALGFNLLPQGVYEEYGVPFFLPLAIGGAAILYDALRVRSWAWRGTFVLALVVVQVFTPLLVLRHGPPERRGTLSAWLTPKALPYNHDLPAQLAAAREAVAAALAPDAPFIGSNIILAAETGRAVPPDLRMGPFSFTVEIPPERAARLHLATHEEIDGYFARRDITVLGFFVRRELDYGWSIPSFDQLKPEFHAAWFAPLARDFVTSPASSDTFVIMIRK